MGKQASAVPSQLSGYSGWATQQNTDLMVAARKLNAALEKVNRAGNSSYVLGQVAYLGNDVLGYATRNQRTDSWVGSVGRAFEDADRQRVGAQRYRMEFQDFQNSRVTIDDASITSRVGGDPVALGLRDAEAVELAAQLKEAEDTQDVARVRAIIAQLAGHMKDSDYAAAFFNELGPDATRDAIMFIHDEGDPDQLRLLRIYDTALASATNSASWDPDFSARMWPPGGGASKDQILLLQYSSVAFSEDFLTRAADSTLFYPEGSHATLDPEYARVVFDALAQNPDAALHYLIGNAPDGSGGQTPFNRTVSLLRDYQNELRNDDGGAGGALSALIAAASRSPEAMTAYVGPFGTEPEIQVLLHELSAVPDPWMPNSIRPGIRQAIADHIDLFVPPVDPRHPVAPEVGTDWTWQEKIFKAAVADNEGHVDLAGVQQLQDAIQRWAVQAGSHLVNSHDGVSLDAYRAYLYQVGALWGLAALPVRQGGYDKEHLREIQIDGLKTLVGLIPIPIPLKEEGAKAITEYVVDHVDEWSREIGARAAIAAGADADEESVEIYYRQLGGMRLMLAQQFVAQNPSLVSGMSPDQAAEYIHQLAEGTDPSGGSNADVAHFEFELDSASKTFAEQFNNPKR